mgnify:CR=1 FL=1
MNTHSSTSDGMRSFSNEITVPVLNRRGFPIGEQTFVNTAWREFFPEDYFAIVKMELDPKERRPNATDFDKSFEVTYKDPEGRKFTRVMHGAIGWGSSIKGGDYRIYQNDFSPKFLRLAEDAYRIGAAFHAQGLYGSLRGKMAVRFVPTGTDGLEDGMAVIRYAPTVEHEYQFRLSAYSEEDGGWLVTGTAFKDHYLGDAFWKKYPGADAVIASDCVKMWPTKPADEFEMVGGVPKVGNDGKPIIKAKKKNLPSELTLDDCVLVFTERSGDRQGAGVSAWRNSYQVMQQFEHTPELWAEILPSLLSHIESLHLIKDSNHARPGWLNDADGNRDGLSGLDPEMVYHPYLARQMGNLWAKRAHMVTLTGGLPMNGFYVSALPRSLFAENELVAAMSQSRKSVVVRYPIPGPQNLIPMFNVAFDSGLNKEQRQFIFWASQKVGVMFVHHKLWKQAAGDFDGDKGAIIEADDRPELWRQANAHYAEWADKMEPPKLRKTATLITPENDTRAVAMARSVTNLIGHGTNVLSTMLDVGYDQLDALASVLNFKDKFAMVKYVQRAMQVGTDLFKTSESPEQYEKRLGQIDSLLAKEGIVANWLLWGRTGAFKSFIPDPETLHGTGLVARIARYVLPQLQIPDDVAVKPLSAYTNWAEGHPEEITEAAVRLHKHWKGNVIHVNYSDPDAWGDWCLTWQDKCRKAAAAVGCSTWQLANALWIVEHTGQELGQQIAAAGVFSGFPEEVRRLITEKPGTALNDISEAQTVVTVNGIKYQYAKLPDTFFADVEVVEYEQKVGGRPVLRAALCGELKVGEKVKQVARPAYMPANLIAVMDNKGFAVSGVYHAAFVKKTAGTYEVTLR